MVTLLAAAFTETVASVTYTLDLLEEDHGPEGNFSLQEDVDFVRAGIARNDPWAWFCAKVTARVEGSDAIGVDYLGGCSYENKASFVQSDGYWPDMKANALTDLRRKLADRVVAGHNASIALLGEAFKE